MSSSHPEIPLLDLEEQHAAIRSELDEAIARVLDSHRFVLGAEVERFETAIAKFCDAEHAIGCASGSDALLLALMALGIGPGDQVLCPSFSFFATASSIARLGAEPVFVDIEAAGFGIDPSALEHALARCTNAKAVVPVHLFGQSAAIGEVEAIARGHGLACIVDAAQAIGCLDASGRRIGARGEFSCLSFFPTKNLGAMGDAGLVFTGDPEFAESLRSLRVHGSGGGPVHDRVGINSRLDALQAAILEVKLRHLPRWEEGRRSNADGYDAIFHEAGATDSRTPLADGGFPLRTPARPTEPARHVFNQYVIRVPAERRDGLRAFLADRGIGSAIYYPLPLHHQPCFAELPSARHALPEAEAAARESVALPIFAELGPTRVARVAEAVRTFLER